MRRTALVKVPNGGADLPEVGSCGVFRQRDRDHMGEEWHDDPVHQSVGFSRLFCLGNALLLSETHHLQCIALGDDERLKEDDAGMRFVLERLYNFHLAP